MKDVYKGKSVNVSPVYLSDAVKSALLDITCEHNFEYPYEETIRMLLKECGYEIED